MRSQCVQYVIAEHILILITDHIEVTSPGSFKMWAIFNWWAHCDYFVSVNTMSSQCTCWVFDPLSPVAGPHVGSREGDVQRLVDSNREPYLGHHKPEDRHRRATRRLDDHRQGPGGEIRSERPPISGDISHSNLGVARP